MKILVTGAHGFLGSSLVNYFERLNSLIHQNPQLYDYNQLKIIPLSRKELDLTDKQQVDDFFQNNQIDVVLNTSALGGKRKITDTSDIVYQNILMFENLARHNDKFKFMINFGTGAELDRDKGFDNAVENEVINRVPLDYYGFSKNIIAKRIIDLNTNIHNFRIFNVFSELETIDRFIKSNILNYKNKESIIIHQDRYFDFFWMHDIIQVIYFYIQNYNDNLPKTLNMIYKDKKTLSDIASFINTLGSHEVPIEIVTNTFGSSYTGDGTQLDSLGIKFLGLEMGIKEMYLNL
jgi:nucleoside-diphosphate-sugar epimerase